MRKLSYSDEEISVHLIRGKEVPKSLLESPTKVVDPDRRTSKRSRRTWSGEVCNLRVSGTTTVYQLKMMIWEYFGVRNLTFTRSGGLYSLSQILIGIHLENAEKSR